MRWVQGGGGGVGIYLGGQGVIMGVTLLREEAAVNNFGVCCS